MTDFKIAESKSAPVSVPIDAASATADNANPTKLIATTAPVSASLDAFASEFSAQDMASIDRAKKLWVAVGRKDAAARTQKGVLTKTKAETKELREKLAQELAPMKDELAGRGRDGLWGAYLKRIGMPRTTADRWIRDHRSKGLVSVEKLTSGELPTLEQQVSAVAQYFRKKLEPYVTPETTNEDLLRLLGATLAKA